MRRIYESDALSRDDDDSFSPKEQDDDTSPQAFRSINASVWSDHFVPHRFRCWAVSVSLSTPKEEFERDEHVPFRVTMENRLPMPVSIKTSSKILWQWAVNGHRRAERVSLRDIPKETSKFQLDRGETVRFTKAWDQMFRITEREWEPASPGEYTLQVGINVVGESDYNLTDETKIRILP